MLNDLDYYFLGSPGNTKTWYFVATLLNQSPNPVVVQFNNGTYGLTDTVQPTSQIVKTWIINSETTPQSFNVTAVDKVTGQNLMINHDAISFELKPREEPAPHTLVIGELLTTRIFL